MPLRDEAPETLAKIARGAPRHREDAVAAFRAVLASDGGPPRRPWVFADPLGSMDPATTGVLADVFGDAGPDLLFIGRLPMDAKLKRGVEEIALPALRRSDTREIADAILGASIPAEVSRRTVHRGRRLRTRSGVACRLTSFVESSAQSSTIFSPRSSFMWRSASALPRASSTGWWVCLVLRRCLKVWNVSLTRPL